ncbi:uncharacterized protein LOC8063854 isoform X1 [Sorghum bicolor]|uniref:uncharacterized protein LOC8063854 isoform X1 n=1 Tax=Sorghum bicolor TaxID=4558 RepID=UPI000B4266B1|nr:uncharacterized protein LOC8063854 isoform X1 [Sorghum bicolor]|eukprot:XP_021308772.1 uncharacterized protein LOC8063854 isoform X1 [Sorghum bicolor]
MVGPGGALAAAPRLLVLVLLSFLAGGARASPATDALRRVSPLAAAGGLCQQLLLPQGYPCTEHTVQTDDGFLLSLQHIPHGKNGIPDNAGPPVFLQHGLFQGGDTWFINSNEQSLGYILADNGFDVWIGNVRGTRWSKGHSTLSVHDKLFWEWSWQDLAEYDVLAMLSYVYTITQSKISYVGHSQGTIMGLAAFTMPEIVKMISSAVLLCPISYLDHISASFVLRAVAMHLDQMLVAMGIHQLNFRSDMGVQILDSLCDDEHLDCNDLLSSITGTATSPVARDTSGPLPCPGPEVPPSGPAPAPDAGPGSAPSPPVRFAQPVRVYQRRAPDVGTGPASPTPAPLARYAQPVRVYQRRARLAPLPPAAPVAPSPPGSPAPPATSSPPATPTPPPRHPATRAATPVYHPPLLHRHPRHVHPMVTRHAAGTLQPRALAAMPGDSQVSPVPSSVREALLDPHWRRAMEEEYAALLANQTWDLVPRPPGSNIVTGKWIWTHKRRADGTLERYKARWVLRGFTQRPGVDYDETFSPVVKPATVRTVLSLALTRGWPVHQLDVKNAFLHGVLTETVYCSQPAGFVDSACPDMVCRLNKSLYGLKQAPRAWNHRFAAFLQTLGFVEAKSDTSLFIYHYGTETAYLLLYVDDIVLTASTESLLRRIIASLQQEFAMKDLGALHHFLGVTVQPHPAGLLLHQRQYTLDILERAGMTDCKPCSTPVDTQGKISEAEGIPVTDPTAYRSLAGALQYLTFTRPDITYAVQQICLHMHDPREPHLTALKRILRYLRGTVDFGLLLHRRSPSTELVVYTDADWAGYPDTRRSTSGYAVFLGGNLVSWSSKRQPVVSRSSAEAEYRAVANGVAEASWLRQLLAELHSPLSRSALVYCDNVSAVYLSTNPVQHQRTKHVEIDLHFVRDRVAVGDVRVLHVPTTSQFADIFTKGLPSSTFTEFRTSLNITSG